jgi:hypothetical protein
MTIIGTDGRAVQFAGDDGVVIDRRVADRRAVDHNVPERREGDRRAETKPEPEPRKSTAKGWLDNHEGRNINAWMEDLLSRIELRVGIDYTITHQDGTEEEVHVTELSRAANAGC